MKNTSPRLFSIVLSFALLSCATNACRAADAVPVKAAAAKDQVQFIQVPSAKMKRSIAVAVTLPKNYKETDAPHPVVYLLHGAGDNEHGWVDRTPVREMADTYGVIIVSPAAELSWYFDSAEDKNLQFENFVSSELVAYVDAHYKTRANRGGRALAGNSMGGHGAMFLAIRHKDVFSAAAPMSGGVDLFGSDPQVGTFANNWGLPHVLGNVKTNAARWQASSVLSLADGLKPGELDVSIECGDHDFFLKANRALDAKLTAKGIAHGYAEHPGAHNWDFWKEALRRQMLFLSKHFIKAKADEESNPAAVPAARSDGGYDWMARHNAILAAKSTNPQIVFIGDSITHHLGGVPASTGPFVHAGVNPLWAAATKEEGPGLNLGFGADWTQHLLWRLDHGELDGLNPKRVVLMIGTNNVLWGNGDADQVVAGVRACLLRIREKTPHAKITLMGILPCRNPATHPNRVLAARVNVGLALLAKEAQVDYLDIGSKFLDAQGNIPATLMSDAIHPTPAGYEIWRAALAPTLAADAK